MEAFIEEYHGFETLAITIDGYRYVFLTHQYSEIEYLLEKYQIDYYRHIKKFYTEHEE